MIHYYTLFENMTQAIHVYYVVTGFYTLQMHYKVHPIL